MTTPPRPTGRREGDWIVLTRSFAAPIDDVWAAVTEPERMARWIGTWTGDPSTGNVAFTMTAEGDDVEAADYAIERCEPPRLLEVATAADGTTWRIRLELREHGGRTVLELGQRLTDAEVAASVGPGWEYYLDRLVAAEGGQDPAAIRFEDYYPSQADAYRALVPA